jgi:hypothetical protein
MVTPISGACGDLSVCGGRRPPSSIKGALMSVAIARPRLVVLVLLALTVLLAAASPVSAAPNDNPYVGSWVADDLPIGTELRVQISNSGRFHTWDEQVTSGICVGGLVTHQGRGEFTEGSFVVKAPFKRLCHPADGSDAFNLPQLPELLTITYAYDPPSDTLVLTVALDGNVLEEGTCYERRGSDACGT